MSLIHYAKKEQGVCVQPYIGVLAGGWRNEKRYTGTEATTKMLPRWLGKGMQDVNKRAHVTICATFHGSEFFFC